MSEISQIFQQLVAIYTEEPIEYPQLKPVTLAQWMLESGYGASELATQHFNFGGLKCRGKMDGLKVTEIKYLAHDGWDQYYKFGTLQDFIKGYWKFLDRPPYKGWREHVSTGRDYIQFIGPIYCPSSSAYASKVIDLIPEAERLLQVSSSNPVDAANNVSSIAADGKYKVKFYTGDYQTRQESANKDKDTDKGEVIAYVEHHFNSSPSKNGNFPDYAVVITGSNASVTSRNWGRWYAHAIAKEFGTRVEGDDGIKVGGYEGRGDYNLKYTRMPAILLEPLFASNPEQANLIRSDSGQTRLARVLVESIYRFFPNGGLIAFSVGHKYKTSKPKDRGAPVAGGGWEADFAELVLQKAKVMLEQTTAVETERQIRVMKNNKIIFSEVLDEDDEVIWDPARGLLQVVDTE